MPYRRKLFLKFTEDSAIDHLGGNECHLFGTDQGPVSTCIAFVRDVCMLLLALYRVFKRMEPLSFYSHTETDVVKQFLSGNLWIYAKI